MARLTGIFCIVVVIYGYLMVAFPSSFTVSNHIELAGRLAFYGVLTLGAGILIVAGGIDLSIGSVVGLCAVAFGLLLKKDWSPVGAASVVIAIAAFLGLIHGLLITKLNLQPFLVTLCGLFIYRGLARKLTTESVSIPERVDVEQFQKLLVGQTKLFESIPQFVIPRDLALLILFAGIFTLLLHASVYGRYLYAIGYNEQAARYAGVFTDRYKIFAYVLCAALAGLGGILFLFKYGNALPSSAGSWLELYAITGAVLGGCSLKGGEGTIPGMILGAAVLPLLRQICVVHPKIGSDIEFTVIGIALLLGTIANELISRRYAARKK